MAQLDRFPAALVSPRASALMLGAALLVNAKVVRCKRFILTF